MFHLIDSSISKGSTLHAGWPVVSLRVRVPAGLVQPGSLYRSVRRSLRTVQAVLTSPGVSPRSAGSSPATWGGWRTHFQTGSAIAAPAMAYLSVESQRVWTSSLQSLQALGRQASRMLRTSSFGRHLAGAAAAAEELQQAVDAGQVPLTLSPTLEQLQDSLSR